MSTKLYTIQEEIFNSISHGIGVFLTMGLTIPILIGAVMESNYLKLTAFIVYMVCVMAMFLSSTLYHAITHEKAKRILRLIDHCAIFICIAGTYTPVLLLGMDSLTMVIVLPLIWTLALAGIILKVVSFVKGSFKKLEIPSLILYLAMGWISVFLAKQMIDNLGWAFFAFIAGGGLLYSVGVYFYKNKRIKFNHGIWHLFILAASLMMFAGIALYLG